MRFMQSSRRSSRFVRGESEVSIHVVTVLIFLGGRRLQGYSEGFSHFKSLRPTCTAVAEAALASTPPPVLVAATLVVFLNA